MPPVERNSKRNQAVQAASNTGDLPAKENDEAWETKDVLDIGGVGGYPDVGEDREDSQRSPGKSHKELESTETQTEFNSIAYHARSICFDLVQMVLKDEDNGKKRSFRSKVSLRMWELVNEILASHPTTYSSIVSKLGSTENGNLAFRSLMIMCDEVFDNGQVSWGRIIAVFAFCVEAARYYKKTNCGYLAWYCADCLSLYVGEKVAPWIEKEGGWESIEKAFPPKNNTERVLWNGLLTAGVGLGVLATVIKVLR